MSGYKVLPKVSCLVSISSQNERKEEIRTVIVCEASIIYRLYASSRNRQPLTKSWQCKKLWLTNSEPQE